MMPSGEMNKFIFNVLVPTDFADRCWLLNSTKLYCQIPANLV
jgi:hypothetical protein